MNTPLVHRVRRPLVPSAHPPVLVLLHGFGSDENDLFALAPAFDPRFLVISPRAPLALRPGSHAWFPVRFTPEGPVADAVEAETSLKVLSDFLGWAMDEYQADPARLTLVGFSQGAILASGLALTKPEKVRAVVMMSGRILPEFAFGARSPRSGTEPSWLVVHGTQDGVLPVIHGRSSAQTLKDLGIQADYREFSMGHSVTDESLAVVTEWITRIFD